MSIDNKTIEDILKTGYKRETWKGFLRNLFPLSTFWNQPQSLKDITSPYVTSTIRLGDVKVDEGGIERNIGLFEVVLDEKVILERNRVGLRNLLKKYWRDMDGAFIVYTQPSYGLWRFTYVSELTGFDSSGEYQEIKTDPKRYTYVFGDGESCRTAVERFLTLLAKGKKATIADIIEAFSVEKLSKSFFDNYKKQYEHFCEYLISRPGIFKTNFNGDEKTVRDFVKLFLGRITFLYFIQKKGWLGVPMNCDWGAGDKQFLSNIFNRFKHKSLFYQDVLTNLFFDTLNTPRENDLIELPDGEKVKVPFLNGGLFEEENPNYRNIVFKEELFQELFNFFNQYNFTIHEDDPNDHTVAVDPEMLGHIFENLLEDNKDKGAYYTPKEIVHYMCQESLIEYLTTWFENKGYEVVGYTSFKDTTKTLFIDPNEYTHGQLELETPIYDSDKKIDRSLIERMLKKSLEDSDSSLLVQYFDEFNKALDSVKICDPAIGSGAFPMGLLQEIFSVKQTIWHFKYGNLDDFPASETKLNIIQNSIYGVDIEKGAVDIARLRFWLSLVVDETEPKPLPNLDYKIVVGNSLVSKLDDVVINIDWDIDVTSAGMFGQELLQKKSDLLKQIIETQKEYFFPKSDKKTLALEIRNLKIDLLINHLNLLVETHGLKEKPTFKDRSFTALMNNYLQTQGWLNQVAYLKNLLEYIEEPLNFFEWKLNFPEVMNTEVTKTVGFDIVIGNPPYVEAKKLKHISRFLKHYQVYTGTSDLSSYFFELCHRLNKINGVFCLINTNKFFNTGYGKPVRQLLIGNQILQILNFEQVEVFEDILVSSVIISSKKRNPEKNNRFKYKKFYKLKHSEFVRKFKQAMQTNDTYSQADLTNEEWSFADNSSLLLKRKIEQGSIQLKNLEGVKVFRGVTTGCNPAFIINEQEREDLITKDSKNSSVIKPLLQGRNIRKWNYVSSDEYLLFIPWHFPLHGNTDINGKSILAELKFQEEYKFIYDHLLKFKEELRGRNQEETDIRYEWYALQRCAATYYYEFEKPKIVWGLTADKWAFAFEDKGHYLPSNGYILTSKNISLKYLLAILNSNLLKYYFGFIGVMTAGGAYTLKHATILELPFKLTSDQTRVANLVDSILKDKAMGKDVQDLELQIDELVYRLYGLTYEEVLVIDPSFPLTEEEYRQIEYE
jgi:adenine-specific DNA-methyltransferase